jgi:hypothetical protein
MVSKIGIDMALALHAGMGDGAEMGRAHALGELP